MCTCLSDIAAQLTGGHYNAGGTILRAAIQPARLRLTVTYPGRPGPSLRHSIAIETAYCPVCGKPHKG